MGSRHRQTLLQGRHPNGQQTHEKVLDITRHQGNKNQNHSEIPLHTPEEYNLKKKYKYLSVCVLVYVYIHTHICVWMRSLLDLPKLQITFCCLVSQQCCPSTDPFFRMQKINENAILTKTFEIQFTCYDKLLKQGRCILSLAGSNI